MKITEKFTEKITENTPEFTPSVVRAGEGTVVQLGNNRIWVKVSSHDSAGTLLVGEVEAAAGSGVPPHIHTREDETFYILSGRFGILIGDRSIEAGPGDSVFAPRDVPHAWHCLEPGRALVLVTPGDNFEAFATAMTVMGYDPQADIADPVRMSGFRALTARHGIQMLPPK